MALPSNFWTSAWADYIGPRDVHTQLSDFTYAGINNNLPPDSDPDWYTIYEADIVSVLSDGIFTFLGGAIDYDDSTGNSEDGTLTVYNSDGDKLQFDTVNIGARGTFYPDTKAYQSDDGSCLLYRWSKEGWLYMVKARNESSTTPLVAEKVDSIRVQGPTFAYGPPAAAIPALLMHCSANYLGDVNYDFSYDADTWDDAWDGQYDSVGADWKIGIMYTRESGKTFGDAVKKMARHCSDLLAINMGGELCLYRRYGLSASYTVSGLAADDGIVSTKWRYAYEHLSNSSLVCWGTWHKGKPKKIWDGAVETNYQHLFTALSRVDAPGDEFLDACYNEYSNAASIAKYGLRELGKGSILYDEEKETSVSARPVEYAAERRYFNLPLIASNSAMENDVAVGEAMRDNYMARLDYDAQLRREITVVQDFRGLDYDVGWAVQDVAVTKDGENIGDTRCIRKVVDFSDFTVTSVLLEEPPQVIYTFEDAAPAIDDGDKSYFVRSTSAAKNGAYGIAASGGNVYRTAWDTDRQIAVNGCKIGVWIKAPDDGSHEFKAPGIHFAGTGVGDGGFQAVIDMRGPALSLRRDFSSSNDINSSNNSAVQLDVWYWLEVIGSSTGFTATLYDEPGGTSLLSATRNDTTYTNGYVGLAVYSTGHFDDLTIY